MSYSLFLFADSPVDSFVTKAGLIDYLSDMEFLVGNSSSRQLLLPGNQLMDFITFLGCSPSLKMGELESTIRLHLFAQETGLGGDSIVTIRYPLCKHTVQKPQQLIRDYPEKPDWVCNSCGNQGAIKDINWRRSAGFSTIFIEISSIFPKEAVPSDKLITALSSYTKSQWNWFYSKTI